MSRRRSPPHGGQLGVCNSPQSAGGSGAFSSVPSPPKTPAGKVEESGARVLQIAHKACLQDRRRTPADEPRTCSTCAAPSPAQCARPRGTLAAPPRGSRHATQTLAVSPQLVRGQCMAQRQSGEAGSPRLAGQEPSLLCSQARASTFSAAPVPVGARSAGRPSATLPAAAPRPAHRSRLTLDVAGWLRVAHDARTEVEARPPVCSIGAGWLVNRKASGNLNAAAASMELALGLPVGQNGRPAESWRRAAAKLPLRTEWEWKSE